MRNIKTGVITLLTIVGLLLSFTSNAQSNNDEQRGGPRDQYEQYNHRRDDDHHQYDRRRRNDYGDRYYRNSDRSSCRRGRYGRRLMPPIIGFLHPRANMCHHRRHMRSRCHR